MMAAMRLAFATMLVALLAVRTAGAQDLAQRCAEVARDGDVAACRAAVAANPADIGARRNLAFAYLALNDHDACLAVHRDIVAIAPDDPEAWFGYAAAAATFWDYASAVEPIRVALRLAPDDLMSLRVAAIVFRMAGLPRDALAAMSRGAELGDDLQMAAVAEAYRRGLGTTADPLAGRIWLERAAASGHVGAMQQLAALYRDGADGLPADRAAAEAWSARARRALDGD